MASSEPITKKVINSPETCVDDNLRGVVTLFPKLQLHPKHRVVTVRRKVRCLLSTSLDIFKLERTFVIFNQTDFLSMFVTKSILYLNFLLKHCSDNTSTKKKELFCYLNYCVNFKVMFFFLLSSFFLSGS